MYPNPGRALAVTQLSRRQALAGGLLSLGRFRRRRPNQKEAVVTTPVGHPDFQSYANWRGPIYANQNINVTSVAPFVFGESITNYQSLFLVILNSVAIGVTVDLTFYTDATAAVAVYDKTWVLNPAANLAVTVPAVTNFFKINIHTSQAGTAAVFVYVAPSNNPTPRIVSSMHDDVINLVSVSVNAGATLTALMPYVSEGDGYVAVGAGAYTGPPQFAVQSLTESGAVAANLITSTQFSAPTEVAFKTPPNPVIVTLKNNDSVARTYNIYACVLDN